MTADQASSPPLERLADECGGDIDLILKTFFKFMEGKFRNVTNETLEAKAMRHLREATQAREQAGNSASPKATETADFSDNIYLSPTEKQAADGVGTASPSTTSTMTPHPDVSLGSTAHPLRRPNIRGDNLRTMPRYYWNQEGDKHVEVEWLLAADTLRHDLEVTFGVTWIKLVRAGLPEESWTHELAYPVVKDQCTWHLEQYKATLNGVEHRLFSVHIYLTKAKVDFPSGGLAAEPSPTTKMGLPRWSRVFAHELEGDTNNIKTLLSFHDLSADQQQHIIQAQQDHYKKLQADMEARKLHLDLDQSGLLPELPILPAVTPSSK